MKKVGLGHAIGSFFRVLLKGENKKKLTKPIEITPPSCDLKKLLEGINHRHAIKVNKECKIMIWLSVCNLHYWHEPTCRLCLNGHWVPFKEEWRRK